MLAPIRVFGPLALALAAILAAATAQAADLTVTVRDSSGRPVADAVVIVDAPGRAPAPTRVTINQRDMQFVPSVVVVPVGSTITFGNLDPFRHHVYSFSPPRKFELKLFGQGQTRPVQFDRPGLVAIGCNIHDSMQAFVHVVDTPFASKTDAAGRVTIRGLPGGSHKVRVWHALLRAPANQVTLTADPSRSTLPVTVRLRRPAPMHHDY
ncbi:MAG TPA: methylamine utilization protein [Croceibacterium sp.]|nr:methylamine utilization protein [Croceibacterium sp.]